MRKLSIILTLALALSLILGATALAETVYVDTEAEIREAYKYVLDGEEYQLPTPVSELAANGWSLTESGTLEGMTYNIYPDLIKDDAAISVYVLNPTQEERAIEDCWVCYIKLDLESYDEKELAAGKVFALPGGITADSTSADVLAACGITVERIEGPGEVTGYSSDGSVSTYKVEDMISILKDGISIADYNLSSEENMTYLRYDYRLTGTGFNNVLNNNTMQVGENHFEIWFDKPITQGDGKITRIDLKLMTGPAED